MAPILLDGRTSQNASIANSIDVPVTSSFELWGQVELDVRLANPDFPIRVQFDGTIAFYLSSNPGTGNQTIEVRIVRGENPTNFIVFSGNKKMYFPQQLFFSESYGFNAADYNPPKGNGFLTYSVFVRNVSGGSEFDVKRVGPECFNAVAFGN